MLTRILVALLALIALPAMMFLHFQLFQTQGQKELESSVARVLSAPQYQDVYTPGLQYLDVMLRGFVDAPQTRALAQMQVDALPGVRCRHQDNRIRVRPRVEGKRNGMKLTVSGWLCDSKELATLEAWVRKVRPEVSIDHGKMEFAPFILRVEGEEGPGVPTAYEGVWRAITEQPALYVVQDQPTQLVLSGYLPEKVRNRVVALLAERRPDARIQDEDLKSGSYVQDAFFTSEAALPLLVRACFESQGMKRMSLDSGGLALSGAVTPSQIAGWEPAIHRVAGNAPVSRDFQLYPSPVYFPGRLPQAALAPEKWALLQQLAADWPILFPEGELILGGVEAFKLDVWHQVMQGTDESVAFIIGAHAGIGEEEAALAQRRAEVVKDHLIGLGVTSSRLEAVVFDRVSGWTRENAVECHVK